MRTKVMNICQNIKNPRNGAELWTDYDKKIKELIESSRGIIEYAWILHDKDVYTAEDALNNRKRLAMEYDEQNKASDGTYSGNDNDKTKYIDSNQYVFEGKPKEAHVHLVLLYRNNKDTSFVASKLGIPESQIDVPKGARGRGPEARFLDCVKYLTHESDKEQAKGKHLYSDEDVHANFDWRKALNERKAMAEKYGREELSERDEVRMKILKEGMTIRQALDKYPLTVADDLSKLEKMRGLYLANYAEMPSVRINLYISGKGGVGKGLLSRALAQSWFPELLPEECFFICSKETGFNGYDGQPVVIYDDFRGYEMRKKFGTGNVFNLLDTHPQRIRQNVKFSVTMPINSISIVNGIEEYSQFIEELTGGYYDKEGNYVLSEDQGQVKRRLPVILELHEKDFDILLNHGFFAGTQSFDQYDKYMTVVGNFAVLQKKADEKTLGEKTSAMLKTISKKVDEAKKIESAHGSLSKKYFDDYGKNINTTAEKKATDDKENYTLRIYEDYDKLPF